MLVLSIAGNVGKDAESRVAGSSVVCNFSVAVSGFDFRKKEKTTTWVRVAVWGKRGEQLAKLITKGSKVAVSGEMTLSEYQGKTTVELKAQDVTLLGAGGQRDAPTTSGSSGSADEPYYDDLPF